MSKVILQSVTNVDNTLISAINNNNAVITSAFDNTLSRNGSTPNPMIAALDMNSNPIINVPFASQANQPVTLGQLSNVGSVAVGFPTLIGDVTGTVNTSTGQVPTTISTVNSNIGTFGSTSAIPVITVNAKGQTTAITTASLNSSIVNGVSFPSNPSTNTVPVVTSANTITYEAVPGSAIASNTVANANLSQMAAKTIKGNSTSGTANVSDLTGDSVESLLLFTQAGSGASQRTLDSKIKEYAISVIDFGADPTGAVDSATAINNAIASLPVSGGDVIFPVGTYKIGSTISIGNGSSSAASTRYGVRLIGMGQPIWSTVNAGFATVPSVKLLWSGSASSNMILINGPLQGWGVKNMFLDGASSSSAGQGIKSVSGIFGDCSNLVFQNFTGQAIDMETLTTSSGPTLAATSSQYNTFINTSILIPGSAGAKGILLTGQGTTADTSFCNFINTSIVLSPTQNFGIYLINCDSNYFYGTNIIGTGNVISGGVIFDYTSANTLPSDNTFYGINVTLSSGTSFSNNGTPGASAKPNKLIGVTLVNGLTIPSVANLQKVSLVAT